MEIGHIIPHIEALVFASDRPLAAIDITELINNAFGFMDDKITLEQVSAALDGIIEKYRSEFYPFELRETGGGWQFLTKAEYHKTIAQLNGEKYLKRLSGAALETLAIIAYKQPITKADIEAIRGVSSDYSVQKLLEKELIVITGRDENLPGKPLIYTTSKTFMDYFGLNSVDDLPKLKEVFDETVDPTRTEELSLSVGASGKLESEAPVEAGQVSEDISDENSISGESADDQEPTASPADESTSGAVNVDESDDSVQVAGPGQPMTEDDGDDSTEEIEHSELPAEDEVDDSIALEDNDLPADEGDSNAGIDHHADESEEEEKGGHEQDDELNSGSR